MAETDAAPRIEAQGSIKSFQVKDKALRVTLEMPVTAPRAEELTRLSLRGDVLIKLESLQLTIADTTAADRAQQALPFGGAAAPELCVCSHLAEKHTTAEGVTECWADAVVGEGRCPCVAFEALPGAEDDCFACNHFRRLHDPAGRLAVNVPLTERPGLPLCYAHGLDNPCMCTAWVEPEPVTVVPDGADATPVDADPMAGTTNERPFDERDGELPPAPTALERDDAADAPRAVGAIEPDPES